MPSHRVSLATRANRRTPRAQRRATRHRAQFRTNDFPRARSNPSALARESSRTNPAGALTDVRNEPKNRRAQKYTNELDRRHERTHVSPR